MGYFKTRVHLISLEVNPFEPLSEETFPNGLFSLYQYDIFLLLVV